MISSLGILDGFSSSSSQILSVAAWTTTKDLQAIKKVQFLQKEKILSKTPRKHHELIPPIRAWAYANNWKRANQIDLFCIAFDNDGKNSSSLKAVKGSGILCKWARKVFKCESITCSFPQMKGIIENMPIASLFYKRTANSLCSERHGSK